MKTLMKLFSLFAFMMMGTGAFAQSCIVQITDPNWTSSTLYHYVVALYDFDVSTTNPVEVKSDTINWPSNGGTYQVTFSSQFSKDKTNLYFRAYAKNLTTNKFDEQWSGEFDSGQYYSGVTVTLNIP